MSVLPEWLVRADERAREHLASLDYDQLGPAGRLLVRRDDSNVVPLPVRQMSNQPDRAD